MLGKRLIPGAHEGFGVLESAGILHHCRAGAGLVAVSAVEDGVALRTDSVPWCHAGRCLQVATGLNTVQLHGAVHTHTLTVTSGLMRSDQA